MLTGCFHHYSSWMPAYRHWHGGRRLWIVLVVALIASGLAIWNGRRVKKASSTDANSARTTCSSDETSVPLLMDPLLQEPMAVAPWDCTSCDDSLAAIVNVTKSVLLSQHPMVLFDLILVLVLRIPVTGKVFWNKLMPRIVFSPSALSWWWTSYLKRIAWSNKLVALSRHGRKSMRSLFKTIKRLYKNRSKVSTLTDYTWYVGTSSASGTSHATTNDTV